MEIYRFEFESIAQQREIESKFKFESGKMERRNRGKKRERWKGENRNEKWSSKNVEKWHNFGFHGPFPMGRGSKKLLPVMLE